MKIDYVKIKKFVRYHVLVHSHEKHTRERMPQPAKESSLILVLIRLISID